MASRREQVIAAVKALVSGALPFAEVKRNQDQPDTIPPGGLVIVRDGDPGTPEVDLSPLTYHYQHKIPLELAAYATSAKPREQVLDELLAAIGTAVRANRTLGGLVDWLEADAPISDDLGLGRWADAAIVAQYASADPLN